VSRVAARCPDCQSVFFVSAAQGKVANNLVRCGRCGHLFSVLENLSDSLPEPEPVEVGSPPESEIELELKTESDAGEIDDQTSVAALSVLAEVNDLPDDTSTRAFDLSNLSTGLSEDFDLETAAAQNPGFGRRLSLGLLIIFLSLVVLAGQFVFFNLPQLSQKIAYRSWLQTFCDVLPCELTAYSQPQLIRVEHLQVRAHPDVASSLMVELVLTNTASLEQAYPPLILRFDDLDGKPVAARRLLAEEYLPHSLRGIRMMPIDKSVSIKLAILDPGEQALSYSVSVGQ